MDPHRNVYVASTLDLLEVYEDKQAVYAVYEKLRDAGHHPWLDKEDLLPGQEWAKEIPSAIRSSSCVWVFLSTKSVAKRGYVQKEFKLALETLDDLPEGEVFVIPVLLEDCQVPETFKRFHWIRLDERSGFDKLLKSISRANKAHGTTN